MESIPTDRSGTYCKEALSDLLQVNDGQGSEDPGIWVTRNMIRTAARHSETLEGLLPYVEQSWNNWFGEGKEADGDSADGNRGTDWRMVSSVHSLEFVEAAVLSSFHKNAEAGGMISKQQPKRQ